MRRTASLFDTFLHKSQKGAPLPHKIHSMTTPRLQTTYGNSDEPVYNSDEPRRRLLVVFMADDSCMPIQMVLASSTQQYQHSLGKFKMDDANDALR